MRPALAAPWWALNTSTSGMVISYKTPLLLQPREEVLLGKSLWTWSSRCADMLQLRRTRSSWDMSMIPAAACPHDGDHSRNSQTEPLDGRCYRTKKYVQLISNQKSFCFGGCKGFLAGRFMLAGGGLRSWPCLRSWWYQDLPVLCVLGNGSFHFEFSHSPNPPMPLPLDQVGQLQHPLSCVPSISAAVSS